MNKALIMQFHSQDKLNAAAIGDIKIAHHSSYVSHPLSCSSSPNFTLDSLSYTDNFLN